MCAHDWRAHAWARARLLGVIHVCCTYALCICVRVGALQVCKLGLLTE